MSIRSPLSLASLMALAAAVGCSPEPGVSTTADTGGTPSPLADRCAPDNGGITLPEGFCAILVVDSLPGTRHLDVAANGDIFVARRNWRTSRDAPLRTGGVTVLRDTDGDGVADQSETWGQNGGNDVLVVDGAVYHAPNDAVLRYPLEDGALIPSGPPDTIVSGLPDTRNHTAKSIALDSEGALYVNIGSPSNACMVESRTAGSPGRDPCPELETRAGIWKFDAHRVGQTRADGAHFATGLRNVVALQVHPHNDGLYGVMHGRDQLHDMFPDLFTVDQNAEKPSEELVRIEEGSDFGWPYCYHDPETGSKVLAPEYGGDGTRVDRCGGKDMPIIGFPAHWAPNDLVFYTGTQFPEAYREGAFIAFHGSWNRAPRPQDGYRVVFVPGSVDGPGADWEVFADGFRQEGGDVRSTARPVGLSVGPDGSLYISDSFRGRIWRVVYRGS